MLSDPAAGITGWALSPVTSTAVLGRWHLDPFVAVPLALAAVLYLWGMLRVARRHPTHPWSLGRAGSFLAGLFVVALATLSGIGTYDNVLFWIHMVQHLMLIMVAPVLLVTGSPFLLAMHASRNPLHTWIKRGLRSRAVSVVTCPPVAIVIYAVTIIGTHLTSFQNLVVVDGLAEAGEHALYLVAGCLYLLPIFGNTPTRWRLSHPARLIVVLISMPIDTLTGVVLLMTRHAPWPAYIDQHRSWGPSPLTDVHWGGAVMWIAGDGLMVVLIVVAVFPWFFGSDRTHATMRWIEQARLATFDQHTGWTASGDRHAAIDEESARLDAYNAWLASLPRQHTEPRRK